MLMDTTSRGLCVRVRPPHTIELLGTNAWSFAEGLSRGEPPAFTFCSFRPVRQVVQIKENGLFAEVNETTFRCGGQQCWYAQSVDAEYCFTARSHTQVQTDHA